MALTEASIQRERVLQRKAQKRLLRRRYWQKKKLEANNKKGTGNG